MVKRWNGEIDTLLVYVRIDTDRRPSYTDSLRCCPGGFVLCSTHGIQRPVLPTPHPATCHGSGHHRPREDLGSAEQLLSQSPIRQRHSSRLRIQQSCPSPRPKIRRMAQRSLVRQPHLQLVGRIHRHHGQAVAERVQFRALWKVASDRAPSSAATQQSTKVAREGDRRCPPGPSSDRVSIILRRASCPFVATESHRGYHCNLLDQCPHHLLSIHDHSPEFDCTLLLHLPALTRYLRDYTSIKESDQSLAGSGIRSDGRVLCLLSCVDDTGSFERTRAIPELSSAHVPCVDYT